MMRERKKVVSIVMIITLVLAMLPLPEKKIDAEELGEWEYKVIENDGIEEIVINKYKGGATEIEIPKEIDGKKVTSIGEYAFSECSSLTSINIPDTIMSIGDYAFYNCSSLASISIPDTITKINAGVFHNCSNLASISIPDTIVSIGNSAFYCCSSLTSISIPDTIMSIGNSAFYNCSSLTSISIPDSVTSIGSLAFRSCSSLENIIVSSENSTYDSRNNCNAIIETKTNTLIVGCKNTSIPNSVTSIGRNAFENCSNLKSINIPDSVISIEEFAFSDCSSLESINIPNNIVNISDYMFRSCSSLKSIYIPDSVSSIKDFAFENCNNLESINISNNIKSIGEGAFEDCRSLKSISIPDSVTSIRNGAFKSCSSLTSIVVSSGNSTYDSRDNCNAIIETKTNILMVGCKNTSIPNSVSSIRNGAFENCNSLENISIPNGVMSIESYAFRNCRSLKSISIPDSVTSIESYAFNGCDQLSIYCNKESYAENYAITMNIPFQYIINDKDQMGEKEPSGDENVTEGEKEPSGDENVTEEEKEPSGEENVTEEEMEPSGEENVTEGEREPSGEENVTEEEKEPTGDENVTEGEKEPSGDGNVTEGEKEPSGDGNVTEGEKEPSGDGNMTEGEKEPSENRIPTIKNNNVTTSLSTIVSKPTAFKQKSATTNSIKLTWKKDSEVSYEIYRSIKKNGNYNKIATVFTNSYIDKKLKAGKNYYYKIYAVKTISKKTYKSSNSSILKAVTKPAKTKVTLKARKKQIKISWKKVIGAEKYEVYMAASKKGKYKKLTSIKKTNYTKKKLKKGKKYYIKVRSYITDGKGKKYYSVYSSVQSVKVK